MSSVASLLITVVALLAYSLLNYFAWNAIGPMLNVAPEWQHLTFMQVFWVLTLWRSVSIIMRSPFIANVKKKD